MVKMKFMTRFFFLAALLLTASYVHAKEIDCLICHEQLVKEKVVHPAVQIGCVACHTAIDARDIPHKNTGKTVKGLSSDQPELCFGCHDKSMFQKKTVHAAISMGCTVCHNPHSSKNEKLLVDGLPDLCFNCHDKNEFMSKKSIHPPVPAGMCTSCHNPHSSDTAKLLIAEPPDLCFTCHDKTMFTSDTIHLPVSLGLCLTCHAQHQSDNDKLLVSGVPELCFTCHDKAMFSKKNVHMPVAAGMCLSCHGPHASKQRFILLKRPVFVCLECHGNIRDELHVIFGLTTGKGHPLGLPKKNKIPAKDPLRQGRDFYCGSCHDPHSSDWQKMFRYEAKSTMTLCQHCHKF